MILPQSDAIPTRFTPPTQIERVSKNDYNARNTPMVPVNHRGVVLLPD